MYEIFGVSAQGAEYADEEEMEKLEEEDIDVDTLVKNCYAGRNNTSGFIKIVRKNRSNYSMNSVIKSQIRHYMATQNGHQLIASSVDLSADDKTFDG